MTLSEQGTDTNQASELFKLCKKVYEKTGWKPTDWQHGIEDGQPLYTSDYLLEKLPVCVVEKYQQVDNKWAYSAKSYSYEKHMRLTEYEETPLKALLKLTIVLSKEGELGNDQSS